MGHSELHKFLGVVERKTLLCFSNKISSEDKTTLKGTRTEV